MSVLQFLLAITTAPAPFPPPPPLSPSPGRTLAMPGAMSSPSPQLHARSLQPGGGWPYAAVSAPAGGAGMYMRPMVQVVQGFDFAGGWAGGHTSPHTPNL